MKLVYLISACLVFLQSCTITERMEISETGMIDYETEVNISEMMPFLFPEHIKDSLKNIGQFPIDTIFSYAQADSYFQTEDKESPDKELEVLKTLDKSYVNFKADENLGHLKFITSKMNIKDFNTYWEQFDSKLIEIAKEDPKLAQRIKENTQFSSVKVHYDGKTFQRISLHDNLKFDSEMFGGEEMMKLFQLKFEYKFPKPIKKSSVDNATFSLDRKTMNIEVSVEEMMKNPKLYNFTVELE